jgi:Winged helix DNA-binding domain
MPGSNSVTMGQVLAWRMWRQYLGDRPAENVVNVAARLCGVQAQVASAAATAVSVRLGRAAGPELDRALYDDRSLVRVWAARGTLHVLTPVSAARQGAVLASLRRWENPAWQRAFGLSADGMQTLLDAIAEVLPGRVLTRDELIAELVEHAHLAQALASGWGTLLKPAAFAGLLCHGPPRGHRVTFTSPSTWIPGWPAVPPVDEAGPALVRDYLGAYGPATAIDFANWIVRQIKASVARRWFAELSDELVTVEVDGTPAFLLAEHLDELLDVPPAPRVRLLGPFDQYVIAVSRDVIPAQHLAKVSRTAGWISPVVLHGGRIAGVWSPDGELELFERGVPKRELNAQLKRMASLG